MPGAKKNKIKTPAPTGAAKVKSTAAEITRYQMEIVRFLASEPGPRTIEEIHEYLGKECGLQRDYHTVRRWLNKIHQDQNHPLHRYLRVREATPAEIQSGINSKAHVAESIAPLPDEPRRSAKAGELVAESSPGLLFKELSAEEAWLLMLAERVLDKIIPQDFFDSALVTVFRAARETLAKDPAMKMLANRIVYVPRGQRLYESPDVADARIEIVQELLRAIRERKMISFIYRGEEKERQVHPIALVYREPKLYLKVLHDGKKSPTDYLCARMTEVYVLDDRPNSIPDDYPVSDVGVDLGLHDKYGLGPGPVKLVLRVDGKGRENLIDDLQRYRLDPAQTIVPVGDDQWELTVPKTMITAQLMEWIAGRQGAVRVIEPAVLASGSLSIRKSIN